MEDSSNKRELGLSEVVMFILHALRCEPYIMPRYMFLLSINIDEHNKIRILSVLHAAAKVLRLPWSRRWRTDEVSRDRDALLLFLFHRYAR